MAETLRSTVSLRLKTGRDHRVLEPQRANEKEAGGHRRKDWASKAAPQNQVLSGNDVLESFFPMTREVPLL